MFGEEFMKNNKKNIKIIYCEKEYELCSSIYDIDSNFHEELLDIKLKIIGTLTNLSHICLMVFNYIMQKIYLN